MTDFRIETSRLILRPIELSDSSEILKYKSDAQTNQFQGWIPECIEDVQEFINHRIASKINQPGTWFQFVITSKNRSEIIGDIGIHFLEVELLHVELGVTLSKAHQRQGFATEALAGIITYLFLKLAKQKITASVDPRNEASVRLLERLGFRKVAYYEKSYFLNGEWVDDLVLGLQRQNWEIRS